MDVFVQRAQVVPVYVNPLLHFVLQEGFDEGQGRFHVPRLPDEVDALEAGREAVLQTLYHELEDAGFEVGALAEGQFRPVDYHDETVGLVVDVVREVLEGVKDCSRKKKQCLNVIKTVCELVMAREETRRSEEECVKTCLMIKANACIIFKLTVN